MRQSKQTGVAMRNFILGRRRRWVVRAFGRNPLLRWTDRIEACAVLAAVVLVLAACPFCVAAGADVYRSHARVYAEQASTRHRVTALVSATRDTPRQPHVTTLAVLAVWSDGAGGARGGDLEVTHARWVAVPRGVADGDQIKLWVNDAGAQVDPPTSAIQAGFDCIGVAAGIWSVLILALVAVVAIVRSPLNQIRQMQLDREINRFASGGKTNRSQ
jgi:hypothetical protein